MRHLPLCVTPRKGTAKVIACGPLPQAERLFSLALGFARHGGVQRLLYVAAVPGDFYSSGSSRDPANGASRRTQPRMTRDGVMAAIIPRQKACVALISGSRPSGW